MSHDRLVRFAFLASLLAFGCSRGASLSGTVPVTGTVTYNGKPLEGAQVGFIPPSPDDKPANGTTDAQGNFTLHTYLGGQANANGALPGDYTVVVFKYEAPPGGGPGDMTANTPMPDAQSGDAPPPGPKLLTPPKYEKQNSSPLKVTVKAGMEPPKFDLTDG